jgi:Protein of unknown function (DUF2510)
MDLTATPGDAGVLIPAGWYEDPAGQSDMRWWDGANWTAHTMMHPPVAPVAPVAPTPLPQQAFGSAPHSWSPQPWSHEPLRTPAVPPWSTPYVWILSVLPLAVLALSYGEFRWELTYGTAGLGGLPIGLTILFIALYVLLAILDYRALGRLGYQKRASPVLIIIPLIYMSGRAAAVRRVTRKGLLPLFVFIAGLILCAVVIALVTVSTVSGLSASNLNQRQLINIEQGIQTALAEQNNIHVTVTCPADAPSTPLNVPFTCTATDSAGASAPITAHFDAPHHFVFEPPTGFPAGS